MRQNCDIFEYVLSMDMDLLINLVEYIYWLAAFSKYSLPYRREMG